MSALNSYPPPDSSKRWWVIASIALVFAATCLRLALNFCHPLAPGIDAAYYPMQTRWLIEHGELLGHAPPLIFWLNAVLTTALRDLAGMSLDDACMLSSRLIDCVMHPWVVLPIMMLGYRWAGGRRDAILGAAAAAALAVMSPPVMRMASDFQKNSLGLVWMAFSIWAIREALHHKTSAHRWVAVTVLVLLSGLTHIGAFGVTCVLLGATLIAYCLVGDSRAAIMRRVALGPAVMLGAAAVMLAVHWIEPGWARRIFDLPSRAMGLVDYRLSPVSVGLAFVVYGVLAAALRGLWIARHTLESSDYAVAIGCLTVLAVLFVPFLEGTWAMRFHLMAPLPAAVLLALGVSRLAVTGAGQWQPKALAVVASLLALSAPFFMQGPAITPAAATELVGLKQYVNEPKNTLVVAPHGVEFWAGMMMHTRVGTSVVDGKVSDYAKVLFLQPKQEATQRPRRPPRDPWSRPGWRPALDERPWRRAESRAPSDSKLVSDGGFFRLYEVESRPASRTSSRRPSEVPR